MRTKSFIMEQIVIQVDNDTAKQWRLSSQKRKQRISRQINVALAKEFCDSHQDNFRQFLDEIGKKMEERGLTEEILQEILEDED
jgi:phosphotransacetylase